MRDIDLVWMATCSVLVLFMQAGFACLESGLTRSKNSINVALKNLADFCITTMCFWFISFSLMFGLSDHGLLGNFHTWMFFSPKETDTHTIVFFLYELMFCGSAVTIISGAIAERVKFLSYVSIAVIMSCTIYPVIGHWIWGGLLSHSSMGWLQSLGFIDFAGSTVVHCTGGWVALAALLIIGPRQGVFLPDGSARAIPGSNLPLAVLGAIILWVGWLGFNGGSTLAVTSKVPLVLMNTMLAPGAGMITATLYAWFTEGHASPSAVINGPLAGLVSVTASSNIILPGSAVIIGAVAGIIVMLFSKLLERLHIDDAVGAIPVHLGGGIWGTLAVALFGDVSQFTQAHTRLGQLIIQLLGITADGIWAFGIAFVLLSLLNKVFPLRVSKEQELVGLNISEHRATTEILDLFNAMETQAQTGDITQRIHEEPFTEAGQIASRYNRVLDRVSFENEVSRRMAELANLAKMQAEESSENLKEKIAEINEFNRMAVGRELRMIELKKEINRLLEQNGQPPAYSIEPINPKDKG